MVALDKSNVVCFGMGRNVIEFLTSDEKLKREVKRKVRSLFRKATLLWIQMNPNETNSNVKL